MQTPVIGKCEDNRGVENASPHFYLLRHHIFLLQEFAFSDFYKLMVEGTEKVDNTVYIWYNVSIKYRRCFYDRTTAEIGAKSIHGNI